MIQAWVRAWAHLRHALLGAAGATLGVVAWIWLRTLRVTIAASPDLPIADTRPWILVFWHGEQFALLAWPRRRTTVVLVSLSSDGELQTHALRRNGLEVVRGSTSRGGATGLLRVARRLLSGHVDAAFAVDGPRGPLHRVSPGALVAAERAGAWLVAMGSASASAHTFVQAWDRYQLPLPFSRVVISVGPALAPGTTTSDEIAAAITSASSRAHAVVASRSNQPTASSGRRS